MRIFNLNKNEVDVCKAIAGSLKSSFKSADSKDFLKNLSLYSCELPRRLREVFRDIKYGYDDGGVIVVRGFPVVDVCETPVNWDYPESYSTNHYIDYIAMVISSLVGEPFGWQTQQKGKLIHDLIPIRGKGAAQTGYGSSSELVLHTEDSFHKYRGDYVSFYCMRNENSVPTTFSSLCNVEIPNEIKEILFQKRFRIRPDDSHVDKNQSRGDLSKSHINELNPSDSNVSMLYGNYDHPYICYDPYYTETDDDDIEARNAMEYLIDRINKNVVHIALQQGDICYVDNRRVVHGRSAFKPNFDGRDRWLKRINITSNLRRSASCRSSADSRIIGEVNSLGLEM